MTHGEGKITIFPLSSSSTAPLLITPSTPPLAQFFLTATPCCCQFSCSIYIDKTPTIYSLQCLCHRKCCRQSIREFITNWVFFLQQKIFPFLDIFKNLLIMLSPLKYEVLAIVREITWTQMGHDTDPVWLYLGCQEFLSFISVCYFFSSPGWKWQQGSHQKLKNVCSHGKQ